eukprot:15233523-Alexandrium_andersonii.AAC.1
MLASAAIRLNPQSAMRKTQQHRFMRSKLELRGPKSDLKIGLRSSRWVHSALSCAEFESADESGASGGPKARNRERATSIRHPPIRNPRNPLLLARGKPTIGVLTIMIGTARSDVLCSRGHRSFTGRNNHMFAGLSCPNLPTGPMPHPRRAWPLHPLTGQTSLSKEVLDDTYTEYR